MRRLTSLFVTMTIVALVSAAVSAKGPVAFARKVTKPRQQNVEVSPKMEVKPTSTHFRSSIQDDPFFFDSGAFGARALSRRSPGQTTPTQMQQPTTRGGAAPSPITIVHPAEEKVKIQGSANGPTNNIRVTPPVSSNSGIPSRTSTAVLNWSKGAQKPQVVQSTGVGTVNGTLTGPVLDARKAPVGKAATEIAVDKRQ